MKVSVRKRRKTQPVECSRKTSMKALPKRKGNSPAPRQLAEVGRASMKALLKRKGNLGFGVSKLGISPPQ